jgi:hypothetical protein
MKLKMKLLLFSFTLFSLSMFSQNINGTYLSENSSATYADGKNETFNNKSIIKINLDENSIPIGKFEIIVGSQNTKLNYTLTGNKKYEYIGDKTFITYDAEFGASKIKCLVGFEVHMEALFITLENKSIFVWEIKEKF